MPKKSEMEQKSAEGVVFAVRWRMPEFSNQGSINQVSKNKEMPKTPGVDKQGNLFKETGWEGTAA